MSLRPRQEAVVSHGSLYAPPIVLKPHLDVGVIMMKDADPDAFFTIEFYYGHVLGDTSGGGFKAGKGQKYVRFKVANLQSRTQRKKLARTIAARLVNKRDKDFDRHFGSISMESDEYVCGSPATSTYSIAFVQRSNETLQLDFFENLAKIIADDASPGQPFTLDNDGHQYEYLYDAHRVHAGTAIEHITGSLTVRRKK